MANATKVADSEDEALSQDSIGSNLTTGDVVFGERGSVFLLRRTPVRGFVTLSWEHNGTEQSMHLPYELWDKVARRYCGWTE